MKDNNYHLLVAEDDPSVRSVVERHFQIRSYEVTSVEDGTHALEVFEGGGIDLAILDINMPGIDGLSLCRHIRESSETPVILMTGNDHETDRIVGLELGADDYVCKPFSVRELEARVKTVLRRCSRSEHAPESAPADDVEAFQFEDWVLDLGRRELRSSDGAPVALTGSEYRLLKAFVEHPNRVLSRDQLMNMTRGHDAMPFDRSIDVQVGRVRKKLGDNGKEPKLIKTFRGEGYVLTGSVVRV
ncbi:MAG: response regulator transcription factor [Xanthomonadales bacterium]|nr:response regulator transcription factor [Xanthomonadales bacterium]